MEQSRLKKTWFERSEFSRRSVLRGGALGTAGLTAAALIGCGGDDDEEPTPGASPSEGATTRPEYAKNAELVSEYEQLAEAEGAPSDFPYTYLEPATEPKPGGIIRYAGSTSPRPQTWDPTKSGGPNTLGAISRYADRLVHYVSGPNMSKYEIELKPGLGQSWEVSPDGLTLTFKLQPGVTYHNIPPVNGRELRAEDVKLLYERAAGGGPQRPILRALKTVTATDNATVQFTLNEPDPDLLVGMGNVLGIFPAEIMDSGLIDTQPIGTGPLILEEINDNIERAKSNPEYWQGKPLLDGYEGTVVVDPAARIAGFRTGQYETAFSMASSLQEAKAIKSSVPDAQISLNPILNCLIAYMLNVENPKFQDVRVRRALSLGFDRQKLVDVAFQGHGKVLPALPWPFIFDEIPGEDTLGQWWRFDPEEAKRLLSAAGAEGLTFEMPGNSASSNIANPDAQNAAAVDFFREIGVTLNLRQVERTEYFQLTYARKWLEDGLDAAIGYIVGPGTATNFYYAGVHSSSPTNISGINDPQIDGWADQVRTELDQEARKELMRRIWDRMQEQVYRIETADQWRNTILGGSVRYWRWNGPYVTNYNGDVGSDFHLGWLDK